MIFGIMMDQEEMVSCKGAKALRKKAIIVSQAAHRAAFFCRELKELSTALRSFFDDAFAAKKIYQRYTLRHFYTSLSFLNAGDGIK